MIGEYGVKSSWTNLVTMSLDDIPTAYFLPLCFTTGGEFVGIGCGIGLVQ